VRFLAIALGVFFFIVKPYKAYRDRRRADEPEDAPVEPDETTVLLRDILEALKK
jgi:large-conductance mechanosensitive channel